MTATVPRAKTTRATPPAFAREIPPDASDSLRGHGTAARGQTPVGVVVSSNPPTGALADGGGDA